MPPPTNNLPAKHTGRRITSLVILLVWFGLLGLAFLNRQNILDWWRLRDYQAPTVVAQLAQQDSMTNFGRKIFYVNKPALTSKSSFSSACPSGGEQTIVLGCYHSGQSGIFLLDVNDPRLSGVEQVTAAHEMLHGAYERLSPADRKQVDAMLKDYYDHQLSDARIRSTVEAYKQSEPNDVINEMHSIFGTEIANLPAGLENYYKRYFNNRQQVAGYAAQYQAEFTSRQQIVADYDAQLESLKRQVDQLEASLKAQEGVINARQANLTALRNSNPQAYNAAVPGYNALIDRYNGDVAELRAMVNQYNDLVAKRNAVALERNQLTKELSNDTTSIDQ